MQLKTKLSLCLTLLVAIATFTIGVGLPCLLNSGSITSLKVQLGEYICPTPPKHDDWDDWDRPKRVEENAKVRDSLLPWIFPAKEVCSQTWWSPLQCSKGWPCWFPWEKNSWRCWWLVQREIYPNIFGWLIWFWQKTLPVKKMSWWNYEKVVSSSKDYSSHPSKKWHLTDPLTKRWFFCNELPKEATTYTRLTKFFTNMNPPTMLRLIVLSSVIIFCVIYAITKKPARRVTRKINLATSSVRVTPETLPGSKTGTESKANSEGPFQKTFEENEKHVQVQPISVTETDPVESSDSIPYEPISGEPISGEPISGEPISGEPISGEPISGEPITGESISGESISGESILAGYIQQKTIPAYSIPAESIKPESKPDELIAARSMRQEPIPAD